MVRCSYTVCCLIGVFSYITTVQLSALINLTLIQYFYLIYHPYSSFVSWPSYVLYSIFPLLQDLVLESSDKVDTCHDSSFL